AGGDPSRDDREGGGRGAEGAFATDARAWRPAGATGDRTGGGPAREASRRSSTRTRTEPDPSPPPGRAVDRTRGGARGPRRPPGSRVPRDLRGAAPPP